MFQGRLRPDLDNALYKVMYHWLSIVLHFTLLPCKWCVADGLPRLPRVFQDDMESRDF